MNFSHFAQLDTETLFFEHDDFSPQTLALEVFNPIDPTEILINGFSFFDIFDLEYRILS